MPAARRSSPSRRRSGRSGSRSRGADGRVMNAAPEFEDCARLAAAHKPVGQGSAGAASVQAYARVDVSHVVSASSSPPRSTTSTAGRTSARRTRRSCADVIARYKRLCGVETPFPDGQRRALAERVQASAREEGLDPLAYCDRMEQRVPRTWRRLDISFDDFIRTTEPRHKAGVTAAGAADPRRAATSTKASTKAGTASAARSSSRRRTSSTATVRCTRRSSPSGSARRTTSSGCRSISSRCSITSPRTRSSSSPRSAATRSCG